MNDEVPKGPESELPTSDPNSTKPLKGPLAWMTRNSVAANLLMFVLLIAGLLGASQTKQEVFPEFDLDQVNVTVAYPGAAPEEVEQGIVLAVEERVRGLDGVKRVESTASEGSGSVRVLLQLDANPQEVLADVKNEVDRITTFPEEAEEPVVALAKSRRQVVSLMIYGDQELQVLHDIAEKARLAILSRDGVSQVEIEGVPPLEIAVEVPRDELKRYGLTLPRIAQEISLASLELPAGAVDTERGEVRVRVADRKKKADELANLVLVSTRTGGKVRLGDIATITDGYEDTKQHNLYNGKNAVRVTAYRTGDETPAGVAALVRDYAEELEAELPPEVGVGIWADDSEILNDRIDLLLRNAGMGLVLVLLILALFLDLRLAFWVSLGIPISFLGGFVVLGSAPNFSINMITLFAFIVTLGMVVDDAIVVGERVHALREEGHKPMRAAILAAQEMAAPVTFAILTTVAAFAPMFFVPGTMGKIFKLIPAVVIAVLLISLVESFFVLPAHLAHMKTGKPTARGPLGVVYRVQDWIARGLDRFIANVYRPLAERLIRIRYIFLAGALAVFILTIGFVASGKVPFNFFPSLEGDLVMVQVRLPYGVPLERTEEIRAKLDGALQSTVDEFGEQYVRGVYTRVGSSAPVQGPGGGQAEVGSHLLGFEVALVPSGERPFTAENFSTFWREHTPELLGLESISYSATTGPGAGAPVAIQLLHRDADVLAQVSTEVVEKLRSYDDLTNIANEYAAGKPQLDYQLRDDARSLGLSSTDVANQLRASFYGAEAIREQRDRNEIKIVARLPQSERESEYDLDRLAIRTPGGGDVPIDYVAKAERTRVPTSIRREDSRRTITVTAELKLGVASPRPVLTDLEQKYFDELREKYPELQVGFVGANREQAEAFGALGRGYLMAMFCIYALLAVPFRSYVQPLIIMAVIPFGFVGAIAGHALMGYGLSIMSMFGLVALSGVVVNDSLVLVDATNKYRREGRSALDAILDGGATRLRPILLTSLTTFFGLVPMLAETSMQARFLIPMAISLAFGVLAATVIVLLMVPALYMTVEDAKNAWSRFQAWIGPAS